MKVLACPSIVEMSLKVETWLFIHSFASFNDQSQLARARCFSPPAMKKGRLWRVREDAEIVGELAKPDIQKTDSQKLQRILNDGCSSA
ncbi:excisionase [Leclercia adecarboxylata]|jgi:hypothetical protein|uniref:excisionase n=1 Tax=Leclercia TaxID=83654 RepID=UPI001E3D6664|nr:MULTISPECIES: excisionase [Leclercia]MDQ2128300.1 excisionase [Leclercia adecarboxylata]MDV7056913.1 excisionase [Leclercia adecarboxylata]